MLRGCGCYDQFMIYCISSSRVPTANVSTPHPPKKIEGPRHGAFPPLLRGSFAALLRRVGAPNPSVGSRTSPWRPRCCSTGNQYPTSKRPVPRELPGRSGRFDEQDVVPRESQRVGTDQVRANPHLRANQPTQNQRGGAEGAE